jgi:hypothetical protein
MPRYWLRCYRWYPTLPHSLIGCNMWSSIIASKFGWFPKVKVSSTTFLLGLLQVHYLLPHSFCVATSWTSYSHIYIRVATSAPYYCHVPFVLLQVELLITTISIRVATSAPYYYHVPYVLLPVELLITTFLLVLLQVQLTIATFLFGNDKHWLWCGDLSFATYGVFCHAHLCSSTNLKH